MSIDVYDDWLSDDYDWIIAIVMIMALAAVVVLSYYFGFSVGAAIGLVLIALVALTALVSLIIALHIYIRSIIRNTRFNPNK